MTDRIHALTVVLEADTRSDDLEPLIRAIKQFRNDVYRHKVTIATLAGTIRAQQNFRESLEKRGLSHGARQENPQTKNGAKANQE